MPNYERILGLENQMEADLMAAALKEEKIPHFIKSFYDSAYDGIYQNYKGWGIIEAPLEYQEKILAIYRDIRAE
jgi:hypothetical protein